MREKLQEIIRRTIGNEEIIITGDMVLLTDLELNSLELVDLVCEAEEAFGVAIPDNEISRFKTVQNVMDYISAHE